MTYEKAIQVRDEYQFLVGQLGKDYNQEISAVIIATSENQLEYVMAFANSDLTDKQFIKNYKTKKYSVLVLFEISFRNYAFDEISLYLDRKSDKS